MRKTEDRGQRTEDGRQKADGVIEGLIKWQKEAAIS